MKSPVTRAPRQFLHDGSCLCLWLWWGIFFVVVAVSHRPPLDFSGISQFHWPWCIPSRWVSGSHREPSSSPDLVSNKGSRRFPHGWLIGCHCYPQACLQVKHLQRMGVGWKEKHLVDFVWVPLRSRMNVLRMVWQSHKASENMSVRSDHPGSGW